MNILPFQINDGMKAHLNALHNTRYMGTGGGGIVKVTLSFTFECVSIEIDHGMTDTELLAELTLNAFNEAKAAVDAAHAEMGTIIMGDMRSKFENEMYEHDSCDCTKCDKTAECPVRPLKEMLKKLNEDSDSQTTG